ncbi:MAG TPA: dynamin family protein, partial [Actinomycetota bacterium]|nr:dynamin family protein [Actinomycetota bacterium]
MQRHPGRVREATGVGGAGLALSGLAEAAGLLGVPEAAEQATEAARRLAALTLEVAVVGEFKRGKSSLINALLGREVLPVGVLPLTAVPTVLERGAPGCVVEFADGRREAHDLAQVGRFVTEEANPGNALGVARVVVRLPAPLLDQGVRLVDTPGVGSVHGHNTLATGAYLPSLDAAVLVVSADPPISEAERGFLTQVVEHAVRLFVVLNKADYLAPDDLARAVGFTERVVRQVLPDWPGPVYALSSRPGVGDPAGLARFREDLARFLREGRAAAAVDAARRVAGRALGALRLTVALERRAAALPVEELDRARQRFDAAAGRLAEEAAADAALLTAAVQRGLGALDEVVAARREALKDRAELLTVEAADRHPDLGAGRLLEVLGAERRALLERVCAQTVEQAGTAAVAAYRRAAQGVAERAATRAEQLQAEAARAFGVPLPRFEPPEADLGVARVSFASPRVTLLADQLAPVAWRLLGAGAARDRALAKARALAADEAEMVLGRLRGATSEQLGEAARQLGA